MAARQLILDLLARDKTGAATKSAAENLEDVGEAAEDAAKATEKLGDQADKAEDEVAKLGKSARTAAQHVDKLDAEIESVEKELRQLAVAFAEAETAADRIDLSKAIRRTQRDLKELQKSRGLLDGLIPKPAALAPVAADAGAKAGTTFLQSFAQSASKVGPLGPVAVGMGLYMAPLLAANISAGILGGAGIGGVIGGLALAKRDSRVQAEAKALGEEVMAALDDSAGAFVPAAVQGIHQLRSSFGRLNKDLTSIFDDSANYVRPLINGLTGLIERVVDGAEKAVAGARPVILALEQNLPRIGNAIGDVLESVADNGPEAATALGHLFDVIELGVRSVGAVVNTLTELYGLLAGGGILGPKVQQEWLAYKIRAEAAAAAGEEFAEGQEIIANKSKEAADAVEAERKAIENLNNMLRAQTDPLFALVDAQDRVTEAQKKYNEAVKRFGPESAEARAASRELAGAALDVNDAASKVAETSDGKLTPAMRRVLEQAKLTPAQIRAIESELGRAQKAADKWDKVNATAVFGANTGQATTRVAALLAQMAKVKSKSVTIRVGVSVGGAVADAVGDIGRRLRPRAAGGPVAAGMAYLVGEKRPEVFVPESDGYVHPSVGAFSRSSGGGMAGGTVTVAASGALDDMERMILKMLRTRPAFAAAVAQFVTRSGGRNG